MLWRTPLDVFDFDAIAAVAFCEHTATHKIVPRAYISNAQSAEFAPAIERVTTCFIEPAPHPYHSARFALLALLARFALVALFGEEPGALREARAS